MKFITILASCLSGTLILLAVYSRTLSDHSALYALISTVPEKFQHQEYEGGVAYLGPTRGYTYANPKSLPVPDGRIGDGLQTAAAGLDAAAGAIDRADSAFDTPTGRPYLNDWTFPAPA
eukprot:CAMPEP_0172166066 /NCGR_PEP_ID=MMETSP1050-20130122/8768_1 /TAXON_ID=233186 /ORGANISM="Cryptomonas curvata, Strain CCAP979/52" /LENGTH=118 /DNA_ID=CAMNT_0012836621 /DNA_START=115 /DNA_END=467 /DNA_ORIENTATION=+